MANLPSGRRISSNRDTYLDFHEQIGEEDEMAPAHSWTADEVPDLTGRSALVTGANSGLGLAAATVLAAHGAVVILACRDTERGAETARRIRAASPDATLDTVRLDLASLASIREAAQRVRTAHPRLDLLINNAGVMLTPPLTTEDGFEMQFGTNHLGHFALTGLMLDRLLAAPDSRIVTVSSNGHRIGRINFDDLQSTRRYRSFSAYAQSKLANLLFTYELQRRLAETGATTIAVAAHPGTANTELERYLRPWMRRVGRFLPRQDAAMGALPILRAAVDADARGADYFGPDGRGQFTGHPIRVRSSRRSHDLDIARRLWQESERLTGITYEFGPCG